MKIIFILSLLGIIACLTYLPIVNVYYNYDYALEKDYSSSYSEYFFRAIVKSGQAMDIVLKFKKEEFISDYFAVTVMGFIDNPVDDYIYNRKNYHSIKYLAGRTYDVEDFTVAAFHYQADNIYLGIIVYYHGNYKPYSYINFRVDVSKYYYSDIKDLTFNTNYTVDTSIFASAVLPFGYENFIRIHNESVDEMEIQLTTHESHKNNSFKVDVCEYKEKPTELEIYYGIGAEKCVIGLENFSDDDKLFRYLFTKDENISYLSIGIRNQISSLSYLNIFIYNDDQPEPTPGPTEGPSDEPSGTPDDKGGSSEKNKLSNILVSLLLLFIL